MGKATCNYCHQEMVQGGGCTMEKFTGLPPRAVQRVPYGEEKFMGLRHQFAQTPPEEREIFKLIGAGKAPQSDEELVAGMRSLQADNCRDCGVAKGNYHHDTCDQEECPVCARQLLSCECEEPPAGLRA